MLNEQSYAERIQPFAPVVPDNIEVSGSGTSSISLRWKEASRSEAYKIYRSESSHKEFTLIAEVASATSYVDLHLASNTVYYYKISSTSDTSESILAKPISASTYALMEPTELRASALDASRISVTWNSAQGAQGYYIYRSTSENGTYSLVSITINPDYTDTGLNANTTYYYKVAAYSGEMTGELVGPVSATTFMNPPPNPPEYIEATSESLTRILVEWGGVAGVDGYRLYRSDNQNGPYVLIAITHSLVYVDEGLAPGTTYFYKVSSFIDISESSLTGPANATTWSLLAPNNVEAEALSQTEIEVKWEAVFGAEEYIVYRSLSENGPYIQIGTTQETNFTDMNLNPSTTYFYRVAIYYGGLIGPQSDFADATTFSPIPSPHAPDNLHAKAVSSSSIILNWDMASGVDGYYIYRSLAEEGDYVLIGSVTDTTYLDEGLFPNTTYYYKVASFIGTLISPEAGPVSATTFPQETIPKTPTCLRAKALGCSCIEICWNAVEDAEGYNIYHSKNPCGPFTFLATTQKTKFIDEGLCHSTIYYYRIESFNGSYIGDRSRTICATTIPKEASWEIYLVITLAVIIILFLFK